MAKTRELIKLYAGYPSLLFTKRSAKILANAAEVLAESEDGLSGQCLQYGSSKGASVYREELAKFLTYNYQEKHPILPENLQITAGATHGVHFTVSSYMETGDYIFVEDPTYFLAISLLRNDLGMKLIPVKTDDKGMDVDHLEKLLQEMKPSASPVSPKRPFWAMVYTMPTFHNPTGRVLHEDRCRQLVDVARQHGLLVFCDDVYNLLHYNEDGLPPRRLLSYEIEHYGKKDGNIISNGSFSKIMGPGARLGWIEASDRIVQRLSKTVIASSGGSFNHYTSQLVAIALREGFQQKLVDDMKIAHTGRVKAMNAVLREHLPHGVKYHEPQGGYFYWLELPVTMDADSLLRHANEKYNLQFIAGHRCSVDQNFRNCIRLSMSYYEKDELVENVKILCQSIGDLM